MSKGSVYLDIPGVGRVIAIWDKLFFKIRVYFYGLVIRKEVLYESSHRIETHLDVVKGVLEIQRSVSFEFCLDEELIEFWRSDLMFEGPHATNFGRAPPPSKGESLLLVGTTVLGSGGVNVSFWVGEDFELLV